MRWAMMLLLCAFPLLPLFFSSLSLPILTGHKMLSFLSPPLYPQTKCKCTPAYLPFFPSSSMDPRPRPHPQSSPALALYPLLRNSWRLRFKKIKTAQGVLQQDTTLTTPILCTTYREGLGCCLHFLVCC